MKLYFEILPGSGCPDETNYNARKSNDVAKRITGLATFRSAWESKAKTTIYIMPTMLQCLSIEGLIK
jgi:hypothetical protein